MYGLYCGWEERGKQLVVYELGRSKARRRQNLRVATNRRMVLGTDQEATQHDNIPFRNIFKHLSVHRVPGQLASH